MYLTADNFPLISQDILRVSKHAIHQKEALQNGYKKCKKIFEIFNFCEIFRVIFEKIMFLKNGQGRHQRGAMPTHFELVGHKIQ